MVTKERMGEIALVLAKQDLKKQKDNVFDPALKRELANIAKVTRIPLEELMEFKKILAKELLEETFGK